MKTKKLLAIILAALMICANFSAFSAIAGSSDGSGTGINVTTTFSKTTGLVRGETDFLLTIGLHNYVNVATAINAFAFKVTYDPAVFTIATSSGIVKASGSGIDLADEDTGTPADQFTINKATLGLITISYIETFSSSTTGLLEGDKVKIKFNVNANAPYGNSTITISNSLAGTPGYPTDFSVSPNNKVTPTFLPASQDIAIVSNSPIITLEPYTTTPTNQDITVTASTSKGTLNETSHTFIENGSFDFIATNTVNGTDYVTTETVTITNIDKVAPIITIGEYSTAPTNQDIIVSASTNEGTLNATSHPFTENGSFDFIATDDAENVTTRTVTIDNIDKVAPVITIATDNTEPTYGVVTVTASTNEGSLNETSHIFAENGSFDFVATDTAGNVTTETVTITNIVTLGFEFTVNNPTARAGETVTISVNIPENSLMVAGNFEMPYDSNLLEVVSATAGSALTVGDAVVVIDTVNNKVTMAYNNGPVNNAGSILDIQFKIKAGLADQKIDLTLSVPNLVTNDSTPIPFTIKQGSVSVADIDIIPPVITIATDNTEPTYGVVTVTASTNEGSLNETSHTFTKNGSFTFIATDEAGNVTEQTVTITNILPFTTTIDYDSMAPVVSVGEDCMIAVRISDLGNNPSGIAAFQATFKFDADAFEVATNPDGSLTEEAYMTIITNPADLTLTLTAPGEITILYLDSNGGSSDTHITDISLLCMINFTAKEGATSIETNFSLEDVVIGNADLQESEVATVRHSNINNSFNITEDTYISNIQPNTTADTIIAGFTLDEFTTIVIKDANGNELIGTDIVGTGMKVCFIQDGEVVFELTVVIFGDVNGDGKVTATDLYIIKRHILEISILENEFLFAANTNGDTECSVTATDLYVTKRHILEIAFIDQSLPINFEQIPD